MSLEYRRQLVESGYLIFTEDSQPDDLLDPRKTHTQLIACLGHLVLMKGWYFQVTALVTDHHDDSDLAPAPLYVGTHKGGWAIDGWPRMGKRDEFYDARATAFPMFLQDIRNSPFIFQVGLAGTANCEQNLAALGPLYFLDTGGDHVHIGCKEW